MIRRRTMSLLSALALCAGVSLASAGVAAQPQPYPGKPIRMIVPFPAGGTTDVVARLVGMKITEMWNQPVVIDNQGGAGGLIGTTAGARAAPDGYVMTLGNNQTHATNATLFEKQVSFDLLKDVQPVARLVSTRHVIVVPADSPYRTLKDLVKAGQTRPLNYASPSTGSAAHLVSESLRLQTGMQGTHIPYKGASPAVLAVIGGQVDFMTASYGSVTQFLQGGKLRALAISGKQREPSLPGVPTFAEEGYDALAADTWIALFAPANTPRTIVQQWSDALAKIMAQADIRQKLEAAGFDISYLPLAETEQFHRNEVPRWGKMVRAAGVTSE
jgi:tripartite-type tricarboxylate transporter receptor subunit TctC